MTLRKRILLSIFSCLIIIGTLELGAAFSVPGIHGVVRQAHAVIGRPLTPVSVAGVARRTTRRTVRRCAAGVYYC
ncbi:hypothetical protein [Acuticoccus kandeliae]|uniref:hypothetical protein n=1 Tax=Acuticoccus kandeliae TaxID=2073160 RepID=UPI000D3E5149|nr:hypothetical protein [Acuticoccus kandeliae]